MAAAPCSMPVEPALSTSRLDTLRDEQLLLWSATPASLPELGPEVGFLRRIGNARAANRLLDEIASEAARLPRDEAGRRAWRESLRERLQRFGEQRLAWPESYRRLLFGDAFYESSVAFARAARAFDPRLPLEQLGQALRNVWIGNSLQMLLECRVGLRPGLFAYSMLYPVTDNWLDDPAIPAARKHAFNARLGRRLAGELLRPDSRHEAAVFRLIETIEREFPRREFPRVYESLLAIQRGQSRSVEQQNAGDASDAQILAISFEKGGSSVLADLHLVGADPNPAQERFAFGYGVFLQLLDDLQDVEADLAAGHETLFTRAARRGTLDEPAARLARFSDAVLDAEGPFAAPQLADCLDLIRRNCRALLVASVAECQARFSRRFRARLTRIWPVSLRAQRRLRRRAQGLLSTLGTPLAKEGRASMLDMLAHDRGAAP